MPVINLGVSQKHPYVQGRNVESDRNRSQAVETSLRTGKELNSHNGSAANIRNIPTYREGTQPEPFRLATS